MKTIWWAQFHLCVYNANKLRSPVRFSFPTSLRDFMWNMSLDDWNRTLLDKSIVLKCIAHNDRSRNFSSSCYCFFWTRNSFYLLSSGALLSYFYVLTVFDMLKGFTPMELSVQLANQYISIISWLMLDTVEKKLDFPAFCLLKQDRKRRYMRNFKKLINSLSFYSLDVATKPELYLF